MGRQGARGLLHRLRDGRRRRRLGRRRVDRVAGLSRLEAEVREGARTPLRTVLESHPGSGERGTLRPVPARSRDLDGGGGAHVKPLARLKESTLYRGAYFLVSLAVL